jgi:hypothetical protein
MKTPAKHHQAGALLKAPPAPRSHRSKSINRRLCGLGAWLFLAGTMVVTANEGFAQGMVHFGNRELPDPPDRRVRDVLSQPITGTNFIAQLLYETSPGSLTPHTDVARFYGSPNLAGWWLATPLRLEGAGGAGVPVQVQVRVWDAGFGGTTEVPPLTFEEAARLGRAWGASEIFTYTQQIGGGVPDIRDWYMLDFRGFQLVPEPGTWALLAIGSGVLLWQCRRRPR